MLNNFSRPRRVVITGVGCETPIGAGREAFWQGLISGASGVRGIDCFDVSAFTVRIYADVRDFDWQAQLNPKDRKHVARTVPCWQRHAKPSRMQGWNPRTCHSMRSGRSASR